VTSVAIVPARNYACEHQCFGSGWREVKRRRTNMFCSRKTTRRLDEIVEAASELLGAQQADAADLVYRDDNAVGALGFSYGVIDAMCLQAGLGMREAHEAFRRYLQQLLPHADEVESTSSLISRISCDEIWRHSIGTGASAGLVFIQNRGSTLSPQFSLRNMLKESSDRHRDAAVRADGTAVSISRRFAEMAITYFLQSH
jgi:hypothetical protein